MPIIGNLSEFPLPEVLLLIGVRTGRLRLLDVPEFGIMDVDLSNGEVQAMHLGSQRFTEAGDMIEKLSAVVQAQGGMFEFRVHPVTEVTRQRPLIVNQLVMSLVCHVDELVAQQQASASHNYWYTLESPRPEIWIEPELHSFFLAACSHLGAGIQLEELANRLQLELNITQQNLTNLRLLGLVKLIDGTDTVRLEGGNLQEQVSRKSNEFLRASRAVGEMKRISGKLSGVTGKLPGMKT
jgi:hypothetical protein